MRGDERGHELGVGGGARGLGCAERQLSAIGLKRRDTFGELGGVGEVAVVRDREVPGGGGAEGRLRVVPAA